MRYVNAGHFPPMVVRRNQTKVKWLDRGGAPVGLFPKSVYEVGSLEFQAGDVMVAYTDGVIESLNAAGEQWGVERLVQTVKASESRIPVQLTDSITVAVDTFSYGAEQRDDMALVVLRAH